MPQERQTKTPPADGGRNRMGQPQPRPADLRTVITPEERHRLIAEAAYSLYEARGRQDGDPLSDWLQAEAEIDAKVKVSA